MRVPPVDNTNLMLDKLNRLKAKKVFSVLAGNFSEAREASKDFARLAVQNLDLVPQTYNPVQGSVSIFSKVGFNCLKFMVSEWFRKFTPEEKELAKWVKEWTVRQKYGRR